MKIKNIVIGDYDLWWDGNKQEMDAIVTEKEIKSPYVLVPDGAGDYRSHVIITPRRKLGF